MDVNPVTPQNAPLHKSPLPLWPISLNQIFLTPPLINLKNFLRSELTKQKIIFPTPSQMLRSLQLTSFAACKVVIVGQDPYHGEGEANGLSFAVNKGVKIPPSLKNIFKELMLDISLSPYHFKHGDLTNWAKQGVLLLNQVLSVEKDLPQSHQNRGWEYFTDGVIQVLNAEKKNVVFILWGSSAGQKRKFIDESKHLVLTGAHPSPLAAHRGFFGKRYFSTANQYLKQNGISPIRWEDLD